jgi:hypothetical protein
VFLAVSGGGLRAQSFPHTRPAPVFLFPGGPSAPLYLLFSALVLRRLFAVRFAVSSAVALRDHHQRPGLPPRLRPEAVARAP